MRRSLLVVGLVAVLIVLALALARFVRRRISPHKYVERWQDLQRFCASKETWPLAIISIAYLAIIIVANGLPVRAATYSPR